MMRKEIFLKEIFKKEKRTEEDFSEVLSLINKSLPEDDPKKRRPDIALAVKELSWEPKIELDDGLKRTIKYFIETIKNN